RSATSGTSSTMRSWPSSRRNVYTASLVTGSAADSRSMFVLMSRRGPLRRGEQLVAPSIGEAALQREDVPAAGLRLALHHPGDRALGHAHLAREVGPRPAAFGHQLADAVDVHGHVLVHVVQLLSATRRCLHADILGWMRATMSS